MGFLSITQLQLIGFKKVGHGVLISDKCSIYSPQNISIGDNVRIDDFSILSAGDGGIEIGNNVHISCYVSMIGAGKITVCDYAQIAARCSIYSSTDDFSGDYLVGTQVSDDSRNVQNGNVTINKFAVLGCNTVIMPNVEIGEGTATGALSFVKHNLMPHSIYVGNPIRFLKNRNNEYEKFC